ncbi:MAG: DUF1028 domain-containing protein [Gaiellales bacterium]
MTFSVAAWDRETGDLGAAVASKFLAVGAVVPWVEAGVGAIATQAHANLAYGRDGLELLRGGAPAQAAVDALTAADDGRAMRQLGLVDATGRAVTYSGDECPDWAGGIVVDGAAIQGNILTGPEVVEAMALAWREHEGAEFPDRLLRVLLEGDRAGGDRRGRQSAAILVKRAGAGYGGVTDQLVDLRVEDHEDPCAELLRLYAIQERLFGSTPAEQWTTVDAALAERIRGALRAQGSDVAAAGSWDAALDDALKDWVGNENLEMRWWGGDRIDPVVLEHLLAQRSGA